MNKIGIIAGSGTLPVVAARNAKTQNIQVYTIGFKNLTDPDIEKYSTTKYFSLGNISSPIEFLKKNCVNTVIMLGKIEHVNVFRDLRPDLRMARIFIKLKDKTPMGIFKTVSEELKKDGIDILDSTIFLKELIAEKGIICGKVSRTEIEEIDYGYNLAKKIADMDIGLSIVIKDRSVISVEAIEGTDECIKRAGSLVKKGGFILIKVARTNQDFRFDLPVIGTKTIEVFSSIGGKIIAIESGKTIIIDKEKTIEMARKSGISIFGI
ncbi:MAG: UDP-2,3-diacylglucosamine diphosphatase LpxI [Elusimicrobiota bacterium]